MSSIPVRKGRATETTINCEGEREGRRERGRKGRREGGRVGGRRSWYENSSSKVLELSAFLALALALHFADI